MCGRRSGDIHIGFHGADERFDLAHERHAQVLVLGEQPALGLFDLQASLRDVEHAALIESQSEQDVNRGSKLVVGFIGERGDADLDAIPRRFEALTQGLDQGRLRRAECAGQQRGRLRDVAAQS